MKINSPESEIQKNQNRVLRKIKTFIKTIWIQTDEIFIIVKELSDKVTTLIFLNFFLRNCHCFLGDSLYMDSIRFAIAGLGSNFAEGSIDTLIIR